MQTFIAVVNLLATVALVAVTWHYAKSTANLVQHIEKQDTLFRLAAEIQARAALAEAKVGDNSVAVLRDLAQKLAADRGAKPSKSLE